MAATMNAATFMGKNFVEIKNFIMNSEDLTLKQMFDITARLVGEQDEINIFDNIQWGKNSWKQLSLIGDETVINLQRTKVYVFSDSVLCLGKILQRPESNEAWKKRIQGIMSEKSYRDYDGINGEPTEFEWNIFPGFTTLQLCGKVNDLLSDLGETPETFTGRILFTEKAIKKNVWQMPESLKYLQRNLVLDNGHLLVQVLKRSGILRKRIAHKELGIISRTRWCWNSQKADVLFSVQRLNCPGVNSRAKDTENCRWPGRWGPQGRSTTGGGGLARVPNLRVCKHLFPWGWHMQGRKDELTSCRGTVWSAWQKPPARRKGGRARLPARVSGRHVVRGRQSSPTLEVRQGEQARLVKTVNIQVRWAAAQPGQDRRLPSVATHSRL